MIDTRVIGVVATVVLCCFAQSGDRVTSLPNFSGQLGIQYSGYININETSGKYLHYWFVEAQQSPSTAPVVLWLNGGPGCSSMDGFLYEQGPMKFGSGETNLTLHTNPWAWSRIANMIFLEAPAGVGFSYSDTPSDYNTDDTQTANDNHMFLRLFFKQFPAYANNPLWITGESYAGIYVPTLAAVVMDDPSMNLKGIMVGNGVTDFKNYDNFWDSLLPLLSGHAIISQKTTDDLNKYCQQGANYNKDKCSAAEQKVSDNMADIDIYDLYTDCYHQRPIPAHMTGFLGKRDVGVVPPCTDAYKATTWLNTAAVKQAIHVKSDITWDICSSKINYNSDISTVIPIYKKMIAMNKYTILIYSGDVDGAVPYVGTSKWVESLELPVQELWTPWYMPKWDGKQVAGYKSVYNGLTFTTVKGSGHMVPQFKPEAAFYMFERTLTGKPL